MIVSETKTLSKIKALTLVGGAEFPLNILNICRMSAPDMVAADGGVNRLWTLGAVPMAVIGDMDSINADARSAFVDKLQAVREQGTTDFEKVLTRVDAQVLLAVGFLGGRLDHTLAALNVLVRHPSRGVILVAEDEVVFVARQGHSRLALTAGGRFALLPMGQAIVSTTGLVWDLHQTALEPNGLVSSSNAVSDGPVTLDVAGPVIVTLPLAELDQAIGYITDSDSD